MQQDANSCTLGFALALHYATHCYTTHISSHLPQNQVPHRHTHLYQLQQNHSTWLLHHLSFLWPVVELLADCAGLGLPCGCLTAADGAFGIGTFTIACATLAIGLV